MLLFLAILALGAPGTEPVVAVEAYRRYGTALARKAERMLHNQEDAADIVHGLFVELLGKPSQELTLPYLYRAVTNRCLNLIRDRAGRERLLAVQEPALRGPARIRCDDQVIGLDLLARLGERLDRAHLEVLVCRYVDDMSQEEIADMLGTSRKTVGKRLQRIRDQVAALAGAAAAEVER